MKIVKGLHKSGEKTINYNGFKANFPMLDVDSFPIFSDEDGKLWSDHLLEFEEKTFKILIDDNGMIRSFSYDATAIGIPSSEVVHIVELDGSSLPTDFFDPELFTNWSWDSEAGIQKRVPEQDEQVLINTEKKKQMMTAILGEITMIQVMEKHDISTETDKKRLALLEKALISLTKIEPTDLNIEWPEI